MDCRKIYLIKETPICYDSTACFMKEIRQALESLQIETVEGNSPEKDSADAVIGINSKWIQQKNSNGKYLADELQIPFFQIILDHPLYHHELLQVPLQNYHVICLDHKHKKYIEEYYPDIKSVTVMTLSIHAEQNLLENFDEYWDKKEVDLLFTGTYTSTAMLRKKWDRLPESIRGEVWELAQRMVENPAKTQEEVLLEMIAEHPAAPVITKERFREAMSWYFLADTYASAFYREKVITALLQAGITIETVGHGWDDFAQLNGISRSQETLLRSHGETPYEKTAALMKKARVCLNVQPWFKAGIHDRIITAMGQGSCVMSDSTPWLQKIFGEKESIFFYQLEQGDQVPELYFQMMKYEKEMKERAKAGYILATEQFSWENQIRNSWKKSQIRL